MSATYDELLSTDLDRARSLLGDTNVEPEENALHSDEHIEAVLALQGSLVAAVAWLADELGARYAQQPGSVTLPNGLSVSWAERVKSWRDLATRMRVEVASATTATGGGLSFVPASYGRVITGTDEFGRGVW